VSRCFVHRVPPVVDHVVAKVAHDREFATVEGRVAHTRQSIVVVSLRVTKFRSGLVTMTSADLMLMSMFSSRVR